MLYWARRLTRSLSSRVVVLASARDRDSCTAEKQANVDGAGLQAGKDIVLRSNQVSRGAGRARLR